MNKDENILIGTEILNLLKTKDITMEEGVEILLGGLNYEM